MEKRRIVLLGATGYTGQRVLRELLARGEQPTLAGRNRTKMLALTGRFEADLPVAEVDVTSTADLARLLDRSDVVLSTVGPFTQLGIATVTAAAQAGAHYLDSSGEGSFVRRVFELDSVAAAQGATVVPAFGYDYVPGNLAGALALTRAGERASRIEIGYFLTRSGHGDELRYRSTLSDAFTLTTGGTRTTLAGAAAEDAYAYRRPRPRAPARLVDERTGQRVRTFRYAGVRRSALTVSGSEHLGLPEAFTTGQRRRVPRLVRAVDAPDTDRRHAHSFSPAAGEGTGNRDAAVPAAPGLHPRTRQQRPFPGNRGRPRPFRCTPGHDRPDRPRPLPDDGIPDRMGRHRHGGAGRHPPNRRARPVAAFGLDALRHGAAESGLHEVDDPPR